MNIIQMHRRIERREFAEACRELDSLRGQLRQRDVVLWCLLHRNGPQAVTPDELNAVPDGAAVRCEPLPDNAGVQFSAIEIEPQEKPDSDAGKTTGESSGS